jgi:signal transduction histidine kinase
MTQVVEEVNTITEDNLNYRLKLKKKAAVDEIDELILTFNALLSRIQRAFVAQRRFVQNASHELKTPLTAIMAEVELALARDRPTEEYQRTLQVVMQETDRLAKITQGLLTLTRLEEGSLKTEMNNVHVETLLQQTLSSFRLHHPEREVVREGEVADTYVVGNEHLLQTALLNILDNAYKYSSDRINVDLQLEDHKVMIQIKDHGIGIPMADLKKIKSPLYRGSNAHAIAGAGLGLSLVDRIVSVHSGSFEILSREGEGTECRIELPVV